MKQKLLRLFLGCLFLIGVAYAQNRQVSGKVTSAVDGSALVGVSVSVQGASAATQTDASGSFSIEAPTNGTLVFTYVGFDRQVVPINNRTVINVTMSSDAAALDEVVVTALGISREKKSLGYASQEVKGDVLSAARGSNALQSLSGNVAGATISTPSSSLGGSARIILRGVGSITGENRPLIVIDGVPMDNSNYNSTNAQRGGGGRDYGDAAFDINPDDIESMNVLKGGPASALYGARAANGVILIKTKSPSQGRDEIVFNSGVSFESLGTTPKLQKLYGGGFSDTFAKATINGKQYDVVDYSADESWGPKLEGQQVLHWDAFDPEDPDNYLKTRPWIYPKNDYKSFFNTGVGYTNSIALAKSYNNTSARLSLSNVSQSGIVPNSDLKRTTVNLGVNSKFSDVFTVSGNINYVRTDGFNRPEIGYGDNSIGQKMFQWGQAQLDYGRMKNYKTSVGEQKSWNRAAWNDATPKFSDNPYWIIYENTAEDHRDRFYGNVEFKYDIMPGLYAVGNIYGDNYTLKINSHVAKGSQALDEHSESIRQHTEMNYEARVHFDHKWDQISLNAFAGVNRRNTSRYSYNGATSGGLIVANLYTVNNSADAPSLDTYVSGKRVNSIYGNVSLGYADLLFLETGMRNDWSSTLPESHNSYFYPSVTGSFVFSQVLEQPWLNFGKLRAGWSKVGNDTDVHNLLDVYSNTVYASSSFLSTPYFMNALSKKNALLKPESKVSYEVGLEAQVLDNRLGFDVTYYHETTSDLIMSVTTGAETGYTSKVMNAGEAVNKGIEAMVNIVPVRKEDFEWNMNINFARNRNEIVDLYEDLQSLQLVNAPFKTTLNAMKGEAYGQLRGSDFIYDSQGNKVVGANGLYLSTDVVSLGSVLPDYNMGFRNSFAYKNFTLSALIDMQKGGKFFSISNMFGSYTGMLEETAANGIRESGLVVEGVTGDVSRDSDGNYTVANTEKNTKNVSAPAYYEHFYNGPAAQNVFNADYVKLREITFSYSIPRKYLGPLNNLVVSAFARNLATWGLDNKNFDPEQATSGSGNIQGFEGGNLPSSKTFGLNLKLQF